MFVESTLSVIKGTGIKYFPYIGKVIGHLCIFNGAIREIVEDAKMIEKLGADDINLLAYRYREIPRNSCIAP